jgi:replicative DNA helicase
MNGFPIKSFDRLPPHDMDAEAATLASFATGDAAVRSAIRATVKKSDFYQVDHQIIYGALCDLADRQDELDMIVVRSELDRRGVLEEIGGTEFLGQVLSCMPSPCHGEHYARIVKDRSRLREIIRITGEIGGMAWAPGADGDDLAQSALDRITRLVSAGHSADYCKLGDAVAEVLDDLDRQASPLISTGYAILDTEIGGVGDGEMVLVAARPSIGKSTLLRQMAVRIAKGGTPVGFLSLEEPRKKIARNILSAEGMIENRKLRSGYLCREEMDSLIAAAAQLYDLPLYLSNGSCRRMPDIRAMVHLWVARHGVKMIFLDYMQRVQSPGKDRYEQVSNASLELSNLWKDVGVGAIVAAQLNRALEGRQDKRPTMADLRDSGQLEQDADGIIFLHREDYYRCSDPEYQPDGIAELIVAKWRDSARGVTVKLQSDLRHQTFREIPESQARTPYVEVFEGGKA